MSLLEVRDLGVEFPTADGVVQAVRGVSFRLEAGQTLGIVGESGSGKSVTMQTVAGLTQGANVSGVALFEGRDLLAMQPEALRHLRGAQIGIVFQDPLSSLHPLYRVGWQVAEVIRAHERHAHAQTRDRVIELFRLVGIPQPERRIDDYPFQFSGGMRQRVMIAMALALTPKLLIADEPTTALDVTVQAQILQLLKRLQAELDLAIVLISHDLGVIAEMVDEAMVMYAGTVVERAPIRTLFESPHHPYTRGLLRSLPTSGGRERLEPIPGQPPSLIRIPDGCPFHPRCPFVMDRCLIDVPPLRAVRAPAHESACWLPSGTAGLGSAADAKRRMAAGATSPRGES
ncbi:MAG: ABC transporter ATP-binding protein [Candidatus Dormibacteraceae bacterium]